MHTLSSWNPINFLDPEARWIGIEILVLLGAFILSKFFAFLLRFLNKRTESPYLNAIAEAIHAPSVALLWFFITLFSIDLVTEGFLGETHPEVVAPIVNAGIVLVLGWFLLRFKDRLIEKILKKRAKKGEPQPDVTSMVAVSKLLSIVIVIITAVLLHDVTGLSFTTLVAFGGVGGLALAFASQEIFSNFFGGFMVHVTRPFVVGETVSVPTHQIDGTIEKIGWYQTLVRDNTKSSVYIPNSLFSKAHLINKSRITHRLVDDSLSFYISPLSTIELIIEDINTYIISHPLLDKEEWAGARIDSFSGPLCKIILTAPLKDATLREYYTHHDKILLHVAQIIVSHGGLLST